MLKRRYITPYNRSRVNLLDQVLTSTLVEKPEHDYMAMKIGRKPYSGGNVL